MTNLSELLTDVADSHLNDHRENGSMPSGHNGPWNDDETPVRNTSHWTILFLHSYDKTGLNKYKKAAEKCLDYLLSEEARPHSETFYHRNTPERDRCNGVIGQAWSIEALATSAQYFDDDQILQTAEDVFLKHPFNDKLGLWRSVDIDGTTLGFDLTFNHQLWFAAAGGLLSEHDESDFEIDRQVRRFINEIPSNLSTYKNGLIQHIYSPEFDLQKYLIVFADGVRTGIAHKMVLNKIQSVLPNRESSSNNTHEKKRSVGYHSYNLYALAMLQEKYPEYNICELTPVSSAIEYAMSDDYRTKISDNPYTYGFNPTGVELAYIYNVFGLENHENITADIAAQFRQTYDPKSHMLSQNTLDKKTLTARLYEATRIADSEIQFNL